MSLDDNQDESYESGASRFASSVFCALCIAPLMLIGLVCVVGWNEHNYVCTAKAINAGKGEVQQVDCTKPAPENSLVMFACDIEKEGLSGTPLKPGGAFDFEFQNTGLIIQSEMYQCVETEHSDTKKSKSGGGGTSTVTTYTYKLEWKDTSVDSSKFHKKNSQNFRDNCGDSNPSWPSEVPETDKKYATSMKVGQFTVQQDLVKEVTLNTPLGDEAPDGWEHTSGYFETDKFLVNPNGLGKVRVKFFGNDWNAPEVTVVGEHVKDGKIQKWQAPDTWMCSGFTLHELKMGAQSENSFFRALQSENSNLTWIIRLIGLLGMWCACSFLLGPLEVVADCIPCIGPMLGDSIACITCCVSCLPATACFLFVFGFFFALMRPMVGIPLMLLLIVVLVVFAYLRCNREKRTEGLAPTRGGWAEGMANYGAALTAPLAAQPMGAYPGAEQPVAAQPFAQQPVAAQPFAAQPVAAQPFAQPIAAQPVMAQPAQPVMAQPRQMQVTVPEGSGPGALVQVVTPEGTTVQTAVPQGATQGGVFTIQY